MPLPVPRKRTPAQSTSLALPHERDERPAAGAPVRPVMRQAKRDLDAGQVDTDNYTRIAAVTANRPPGPTRRRRKP